jgi:hypothetical protein
VRSDQDAIRAIAERISPKNKHCGLDRLSILTASGQLRSKRLESVETDMTKPLALQHNPVVVPPGEQLPFEDHPICGGYDLCHWIQHSPCQRNLRIDIDDHCTAQTHLVTVGLDDVGAARADPPQSRPKAGMGSRLGRVEPKLSGQVRPMDAASFERKQRENPLTH